MSPDHPSSPGPSSGRRLRLGMVGGGQGAFIGAVHRIAARLDDRYELVAGALSSDPERARASGAELFLAPDRCYDDFRAMAVAEAARPDGIDAVAIVTPNHLHFPAAKAFLEAGIHVICDKPMVNTAAEAEELAALVRERGLVFVLTHNYSGYPMIRQARAMVEAGMLGRLRVVQVEYAQDWLATAVEESGQKQAAWRTDPARSGIAGCVGDIGTHAFHLAEFVTGLRCTALAADLGTFVPGRRLDDNAHILLRFGSGARGMLWASQVCPGTTNGLRLRVFGEAGGLDWQQEQPNELRFTPLGEPPRTLLRNGPGSLPAASGISRLPAGHPEGYLEGFAQIYRDAADLIDARLDGRQTPAVPLPTVEDGLRGVRFIHAAVESSGRDAAWVDMAGH
ncbi:Gfo/Idh/MocA family protein [Azospirillum picis]|uniref:Dehydrogenase n=1 Tax=Azospirillum picis TaxID=488438 RepID=A0ABU0MMR1_9PROT|nr:Gfo/Idh/MocA family oxidoreductase [Azospirillum picis]MBP2300791.1 putative dehydrogenase [Azospirillum picis]MDQ0534760.1 putative dehydrogenase [Azospirillum picis]